MGLMSDTRWLSDEEQRVWRDYSAAVDMVREHLERQLQRDSGIPLTYYEVLVNLSEAPERTLRMSELALVSRSSRSRLSHAVARMESLGWVRRSACPDDKRGSFAHLTDEGFAAIEGAAPGHVEAVRETLFDVLSPQQIAELGRISATITEAMRPRCATVLAEEEVS